VSFVAWHRPLRDRPRRYLLVSVGTIFRTDRVYEQKFLELKQAPLEGLLIIKLITQMNGKPQDKFIKN
jgi:hypothetical protein